MSDRQSEADDAMFFATFGCLLPASLIFATAGIIVFVLVTVIF